MKVRRFVGLAFFLGLFVIAATAAAQKKQLRPFWGSMSGEVTFGNPGLCQFQPVQTLSHVGGQVTHLGNATLTSAHCASADGTLALDGQVTFTGANGDELYGTYTGHMVTPPPPLIVEEGELIFTGGTGRFEKVTGRVPFTVYVNPVTPPTADAKWPIRWVFAGTITY